MCYISEIVTDIQWVVQEMPYIKSKYYQNYNMLFFPVESLHCVSTQTFSGKSMFGK